MDFVCLAIHYLPSIFLEFCFSDPNFFFSVNLNSWITAKLNLIKFKVQTHLTL
jgi:hypothetical protein